MRLFPAGTGLFLCVSFSFKKRTRADASKSNLFGGTSNRFLLSFFPPFWLYRYKKTILAYEKDKKRRRRVGYTVEKRVALKAVTSSGVGSISSRSAAAVNSR